MKIRLGEPPFVSVHGEYKRTGNLSLWLRFFGCTLRCGGFSQKDPTDPSTWVDPLEGISPKKFKTIFELPVVSVGCDSIYSIDPKFKHCATDYNSISELVDSMLDVLPTGSWKHSKTGMTYDWAITGGEPLMNQDKIVALFDEMYARDNFPFDVQIETNCTKRLTKDFVDLITSTTDGLHLGQTNWYFSMSPKLFTVSGEPDEKAWHPEIIKQYVSVVGEDNSWLKFVVNNDERSWDELDRKVSELKSMGVNVPVSVMPVGATKEQQEDSEIISKLASRAVNSGYHISPRIHATIWGNTVGT